MSVTARLLVVVLACAAQPWAGQARAETFCKWVDAAGTTHYAQRCPEEVAGRIIDVDAPADWHQAGVGADARAPASSDAGSTDDGSPGAEAAADDAGPAAARAPRTAEELEAAASRAAQQREAAACRAELRRVDELSAGLPVYLDQDGEVHADETLHHWWYRGPRTYLDAPQRRAAFAEAQAAAARLCGPSMDAPRPPVATFTRAPLPRDVIAWLEQPEASPVPVEALCAYADRLARNLRRDRPTNPSDDMRRLDEVLLERCSRR